MFQVINFQELQTNLARYASTLPELSKLETGQPDSSWCLLQNERLTAVCSLWTANVPSYQGYKSAALGHFFAHDQRSGEHLLEFASTQLVTQGIEYLVGPMDGNTWHSYRAVTERGEHPPFFLEPTTPCDWPVRFRSAGFDTIASYSSAKTYDLNYEDRSADRFAAKAVAMKLTVRPFDRSRSREEFMALYELSLASFDNNFLYSPITQDEFLAMYEPLLPYLVPDFFLLAEHEGRLVGLLFAIPDYLQKARGETVDTLIVKTLARLPERRYAGLGSYLGQLVHRQAEAQGYRTVIHALMHDDNASLTISNKSAQTIRRYALYGKKI